MPLAGWLHAHGGGPVAKKRNYVPLGSMQLQCAPLACERVGSAEAQEQHGRAISQQGNTLH